MYMNTGLGWMEKGEGGPRGRVDAGAKEEAAADKVEHKMQNEKCKMRGGKERTRNSQQADPTKLHPSTDKRRTKRRSIHPFHSINDQRK